MFTKTICLNMIVKNEAHCILDTLINLCMQIKFSYWVISDTGSTDSTKEVISQFFKDKNIPGKIVDHQWLNFGHNRSKALESAYNLTDYLLIFDADDKLIGDFKLPVHMILDKYLLTFGGDGVSYVRPLLVNNRKKWCFKGVLHEALHNLESINGETTIAGNYHVVSGRIGARSQNVNKYIEDAIILKKGFEDELTNDYAQACRYAFYCAQSYKDSGEKYMDNAIEWYKKVLTLHNWDQEKFYSCLMIGDLYIRKNDGINALKYWLKSIEYDEERMEGVVNAMNYLRLTEQTLLVSLLYKKFANYKKSADLHGKLFIVNPMYNDEIEFHYSICAFYAKELDEGYNCCKKILTNQIIRPDYLKLTMINMLFYKDIMLKDTPANSLILFYSVNTILNTIGTNSEKFEPSFLELWNLLFDKCKPILVKYNGKIIKKLKEHQDKENKTTNKTTNKTNNPVKIFLSFTTCKRFDLFIQTINSLINHCTDIENVDYWFCVDDNTSESDRQYMQKLYPWINYYMKTSEEKGHRESMNIIFNKLQELKPDYWIHLEDDFLFYDKMNYIGESIKLLDELKDQNIKQILFNRNYGETIESYNILGHLVSKESNNKSDWAIHHYTSGAFPYPNCHYWPHYSLRPSLIKVDAILKIGNYDSPNHFFEMDYAYKWTAAGYKSAFFNKLTNKHIGRLTSERTDNNKPNAYTLNNESQFSLGEPTTQIVHIKHRPIQIVNLKRRVDRKEQTIKVLNDVQINESMYEFIEAVDGQNLEPTAELATLFKDNDFGNRRGFIGCALSHYNLWKQLVNDPNNEYYVIMEDDFYVCSQFKEKYLAMDQQNSFKKEDVIFLGYHIFSKEREKIKDLYDNNNTSTIDIAPLNMTLYIGGFFMYSINKVGAAKLLNYIEQNGIKHGIDYLIKICPNLNCKETQPHLAFSEWVENNNTDVNSDIQRDFVGLDFTKINNNNLDLNNYLFIPNVDHTGDDIYYNKCSINESIVIANKDPNCIGFNTLGFFKNKIDINNLKSSNYFKSTDGIYIKKQLINELEQPNNKIQIKMLCNWTNSEQLCKEWSNMCTDSIHFTWSSNINSKQLQLTWTNDPTKIDYYVIINSTNEYYNLSKTIVFQMEPWVIDPSKNWGVKTWGQWAEPDPTTFLAVRGRKTPTHNNAFWQLELSLDELLIVPEKELTKSNIISSICSSKYFDEGHIARIDLLKFLENKGNIELDIYNYSNDHNFKNYKGPLTPYVDKSKGIIPYKYYFMVENNYEVNFITEKLWEPILCETLVFYYGCPNVHEYIDPQAYVLLPINDFEECYKIMTKAIKEDWFSQRIEIIRKEKQRILNELAFFPILHNIIIQYL